MEHLNLNRQTGRTYPDSSGVSQAFDAVGNRTGMTDSRGTTTWAYDANNLVSQVSYPGGKTIQYGYDANGNRSGMTNPAGGVTQYTLDSRNRLVSLINPLGETTGWTYDPASQVMQIVYGNGAKTVNTYDAAGQVTVMQHLKSDGTLIWSLSYGYDSSGNRVQLSESDGSITTWGYDANNRLTLDVKKDGSGATVYTRTFTYDSVGNRMSLVDGTGTTTYSYNTLNQLAVVQHPDSSMTTYGYDLNGNRSSKTEGGVTTSYAYDFENHLTQISTPSATVGQYAYSGEGLRVGKTTAAGTTQFVYDGQKLLQEEDGTGATTVTYTSTGGTVYAPLVAERRGCAGQFPLLDALGSVRILLDGSQNWVDGYAYDAFGVQIAGGSDANNYRYVGAYGYYLDLETGFDLLTLRYYDAAVGRFVTRDPMGFDGGDWNIYGYVQNQPLGRIDPSGLQWQWVVVVLGGVAVWVLSGCSRRNHPPIIPRPNFNDLLQGIESAGGYVSPAIGGELASAMNTDEGCLLLIGAATAAINNALGADPTGTNPHWRGVIQQANFYINYCKAHFGH